MEFRNFSNIKKSNNTRLVLLKGNTIDVDVDLRDKTKCYRALTSS